MAVLSLLNEHLTLNSVNLSDHVRQAALAVEATALDSTAMGDNWNEVTSGLKAGTLTIEFLDDFALSSIDATLWPIFGTVVTFIVRPDAGVVSTTNPNYTGSVFIQQHNVGGSLNEMAMKSLTLPTSGVVTRATS
ncbi:hypothetical protein [Tenggerimyces flavus]|uniref:Uncharacterized protein n=1 Tax=Tenggerimyces flavus TaxID=1708749 RepID=A0ABV7YCV2_9ACTN|nr:hypothetical protein [Tenggerimyces flavus]MBM7788852.1 hypothetical protein [Tenggerimyces flavus]